MNVMPNVLKPISLCKIKQILFEIDNAIVNTRESIEILVENIVIVNPMKDNEDEMTKENKIRKEGTNHMKEDQQREEKKRKPQEGGGTY